MSPTTSCDAKVYLTDVIDIAPVITPKPRVISLEPISRRTRGKNPRKQVQRAATEGVPQTPVGPEGPQLRPTTATNSTVNENDGLRSPSPSDVSYESQMSSGNASGTEYGIRSVYTATDGVSSQNGSRTTLKGKTITATIDVLRGGFLRGEQVPIRVKVDHTKHIRSLKGIIITLYRQARVDMHPALPVVPNSKGDKTKSEDYYPKSRTGLGGLSLSSAGSSHVFRKDLCQSFAPLFVDPRTLTADVKCTVRVPDEAFPSISNVPGAMISFKYYVEVIVDIQGKLTGLDRMVANAGLVNVPSTSTGPSGGARDDNGSNTFSTWGGNFVDTDQIRREKGVISALFEVVIGTKDSERNGKRKQPHAALAEDQPGVHEIPLNDHSDPNAEHGYDQDYYNYDENGQYYDYSYDPAYYDIPGYEQHSGGAGTSFHVPPAPSAEEQGLSEKEQLRRAEARLLPSQPPDAAGSSIPSQIAQHGIPASAPVIPEEDDQDPTYFAAGSSSAGPVRPVLSFRAASSPMVTSYASATPSLPWRITGHTEDGTRTLTIGSSRIPNASHPGPSAPPLDSYNDADASKPLPAIPPQSSPGSHVPAPDYYPSSSSHVQPTDDKEELQRRRLEMERSAPPTDGDEEAESSQRPSAPPVNETHTVNLAPSAPMLDDDDEGLVDRMRQGRAPQIQVSESRRQSEALPEYRQ